MKGSRSLKGEDDDTHTVLHIGEYQLRDDDENNRDFANRILGEIQEQIFQNIWKNPKTSQNFTKLLFGILRQNGWRVRISSTSLQTIDSAKRPFQIMV